MGNSLAYYNNFYQQITDKCNVAGAKVQIDTMFMPGANIPQLIGLNIPIGKIFWIVIGILNLSLRYYNTSNLFHINFKKLILNYDAIYLQPNNWTNKDCIEIIKCMLKINPKLKIIIYQHFSLAVWDKEIYEYELQSAYKVFIKEFKKYIDKRIFIVDFGEFIKTNINTWDRYLDRDLHPTKLGTSIMVEKLF
ncbi:MAG: hypothetical protein IPJ43_16295 [Saprospiraceae bacterium]|nr:hypothetical protein [Saprospiraceae bacterium]